MAMVERKGEEADCLSFTSNSSIPRDLLVKLSPRDNKQCVFCGEKEISENLCGLLYERQGLVTHYFCLLFTSRVPQNGTYSDGIWGFLMDDIRLELIRASRETCTYCKKPGATIRCCEPRCRKIFHMPCGIRNGSMHQHIKNFKSFCKFHRVTQNVDLEFLQSSAPSLCTICMEDVFSDPSLYIWAPCCKRNWFHRNCLQDMALKFGKSFKCPLCRNNTHFSTRMHALGIYIPHRNPIWEVDDDDNELIRNLDRSHRIVCNAVRCLCFRDEGRNYSEPSGDWNIIPCNICDHNGTHLMCSSQEIRRFEGGWWCNSCRLIRAEPAATRTGNMISISSNIEIQEVTESYNSNNSEIQHRRTENFLPSNSLTPLYTMVHNVMNISRTSNNPQRFRRNLQPSAYVDLTLDDN